MSKILSHIFYVLFLPTFKTTGWRTGLSSVNPTLLLENANNIECHRRGAAYSLPVLYQHCHSYTIVLKDVKISFCLTDLGQYNLYSKRMFKKTTTKRRFSVMKKYLFIGDCFRNITSINHSKALVTGFPNYSVEKLINSSSTYLLIWLFPSSILQVLIPLPVCGDKSLMWAF